MEKASGKIIIEAGLNVWPHELRTAEALAKSGRTVQFVRRSEVDHEKTADILINGVPWELKSPTASNMKAIERNLRRAVLQAECVVFDSRRMKGLPDQAIERELRACVQKRVRRLKHLLFVNRKGAVVDMS